MRCGAASGVPSKRCPRSPIACSPPAAGPTRPWPVLPSPRTSRRRSSSCLRTSARRWCSRTWSDSRMPRSAPPSTSPSAPCAAASTGADPCSAPPWQDTSDERATVMSVQHLGDVISAYLDGELSEPDRAAAEAHLATCMACAAELEATQSIRSVVRALPAVDPPFGLIENILLDERKPNRRRRRPPLWVAGTLAAGSLVILAAVPRQSKSVQPPVSTFVDAHAASTPGADPFSGLAPAAVPVSFRAP